MLKKTVLLIAIISFSSSVFAQKNCTISGTVKDKNSQNSIPYASVVLKLKLNNAFVIGTATNDEGLFTIDNIKSGNYIIEISTIGYSEFRINF